MTVVVNATALSSGGGATILRQFINNASLSGKEFIIFVPVGSLFDFHDNISFIEIDTRNWFRRILWDSFGLKRFVKQQNIDCKLCISLQNTSVNIDCKQLIYLHQPLPFSNLKYSLNKVTAKYFLYKWFYKIFVFLFSTSTTNFVVQTQWMRDALVNNGILASKIFVFTPDINLPDENLTNIEDKLNRLTTDLVTFFYPASSVFYKNHLVVLNALALLKKRQLNKVALFAVTLNVGDHSLFDKTVQHLGLNENIVYLGPISYEQVIKYYISADAVLFPSYIETFGLPLAEAGVLGKKIICADLPYSREVLAGYQGSSFLHYQSAIKWADEMELVMQRKTISNFAPLSFDQCATWKDFFDFI